jgi:hypothetical protein
MKKKHPFPKHLAAKWIKHDRQQAEDKRQAESNAATLSDLEDTIERGFHWFLEVGQALKTIKDKKLWHPRYESFAEYVEVRWKWTTRYANNVVRGAQTALKLGPPYPANEGIARELAKVVENDEEQGQAAWAKFVSENSNPTAKETRAFLRAYLSEPQQAAPAVKPLEERTQRTIRYIENVLSEFYPEPGNAPGTDGWRGDRRRQEFLMTLLHYVEEHYFLAMGAYRTKAKRKSAWERFDEAFPNKDQAKGPL